MVVYIIVSVIHGHTNIKVLNAVRTKSSTTSNTTVFKEQNYESFLRQLTVTEIIHKISDFTKPQNSFAEAYRSCLESLSSSSHFRPYFHRNRFNNILADNL